MQKLIDIPEHFAGTLEPSIQVIDRSFWQANQLEKVASEAWEFIKSVKPKQGRRYILVIAMGAGEHYGANANGDYFPEADLLKNFKNFETQFDKDGKINGGALIYKHHRNKLANNDPWFGTVSKAFYNHKMHRVELLLEVWEDRDPELVQKIDRGDTLAVSMGCRIPYDICSVCGNKARTRADYCQHLQRELNRIYPDGRKVVAINGRYDYSVHPKPLNFFDISVVFRPADKTGYMLKKVAFDHSYHDTVGSAELWEKKEAQDEKIAYLRKLSTIDKIVKGVPIAAKDSTGEIKALRAHKDTLDQIVTRMPKLSDEKIAQLAEFPMNKVLSTLSKAGILLSTPEFVSLVVKKLTGQEVPAHLLQQVAEMQGEFFEKLSEDLDLMEEMEGYDMFQEVEADPAVFDIIEDIRDSRDLTAKGLTKKANYDLLRTSFDLRDAQFPWGDNRGALYTDEVEDPRTGKTYLANQMAIEDGNFYGRIGHLIKAIGSAALLSGVYSYLKSRGNKLAPIAGIAAAAFGAKYLKNALIPSEEGGYLKSKSGYPVHELTTMVEKKASSAEVMATFGPIGATAVLRRYYADREQNGLAGVHRTPLERDLDTAGRIAHVHPYLTAGTGVIGSHLALEGIRSLKRGFRR